MSRLKVVVGVFAVLLGAFVLAAWYDRHHCDGELLANPAGLLRFYVDDAGMTVADDGHTQTQLGFCPTPCFWSLPVLDAGMARFSARQVHEDGGWHVRSSFHNPVCVKWGDTVADPARDPAACKASNGVWQDKGGCCWADSGGRATCNSYQ
jgi:hypothetical protein